MGHSTAGLTSLPPSFNTTQHMPLNRPTQDTGLESHSMRGINTRMPQPRIEAESEGHDQRGPVSQRIGKMSILNRIYTNIKADISADIKRKGGKKNAAISYVKKHSVAMVLGGIVGMAVGSTGGPAGTIFGGIGFSLLFALVQDSGKLGSYYKNAKSELVLEQTQKDINNKFDIEPNMKKMSMAKGITADKQLSYPSLIAKMIKNKQGQTLKEIDLSHNPLVNEKFVCDILTQSMDEQGNHAHNITLDLHKTAVASPSKLERALKDIYGGDIDIQVEQMNSADQSKVSDNLYKISLSNDPLEPAQTHFFVKF